jgi:hypothetical protein
VAAIPILGLVKTFGFNNNFARTGPFARFGVESWTEHFRWGLLGITPMLLVMMAVGVMALAVRFAFRIIEKFGGPPGRAARWLRGIARPPVAALDLDQPAVLAQVVAGAGMLAIMVFVWHRIDLLNAFGSSFNSAPLPMLMPMRESAPARAYYQIELSVLTLALSTGLYKVLQARRRSAAAEGRWTIAALVALVATTIVLNELPYRSFNYRDFERVDYAGGRCYITGETRTEFLILCPGSEPPRNHAVQRDDPKLRRLGIIENVFRGVSTAP